MTALALGAIGRSLMRDAYKAYLLVLKLVLSGNFWWQVKRPAPSKAVILAEAGSLYSLY